MGFVLVAPLVLGLCIMAVQAGMWAVRLVTAHSVVYAAAREAARQPDGAAGRAARAAALARAELPAGTAVRGAVRPLPAGPAVVVTAEIPVDLGVWRFVTLARAEVAVAGS